MNDAFEKRVRAAVPAAWWTVVIWVVWMTAAWLIWLVFLNVRPDWLLALWGGGKLTWETVQTICLWFFGIMKMIMFAFVMVTIFLTLWARRLKKAGDAQV